jgi:hypothetical protein
MNQGRYIFSQLCDFLPVDFFKWLVKKYEGNKYVKSFTCWNHLLVLLFGQLSNREGLRDLVVTLAPHKRAFHHLGFGKSVTRSNLSKANEVRDVRIFREFANRMIAIAREKRAGVKDFFLSNKVYAFDSTTISLCLSVFWWTRLHHGRGGVKMHTLYDVTTDIPSFVIITDASVHDSKVMDQIPYESDSFYIFDRAYMATEHLFQIEMSEAYFVVREKSKILYKVLEDKHCSNPDTGVMADQIIVFTGSKTKKQYPRELRRVVFYDSENNRTLVLYTNNFEVSAEQIALLYKYRWRVELFFKWMKQHLRIKEFYGTSENAVQIQIYAALTAYCLVAIVEHEMQLDMDTYDVLRILSTSLLTRMPLRDLLDKSNWDLEEAEPIGGQFTIDFGE